MIQRIVMVMIIGMSSCIYATNNKEILENFSQDSDGFADPSATDLKRITKSKGSDLYGEITYDSWQIILDYLHLTAHDVLYDLGCGVGKTVAQAHLNTRVGKVVGIELCSNRIKQAHTLKKELHKAGLLKNNQQLIFKKQNILEADLDDATVIYIACYASELIASLAQKLQSSCKPGLRLVTLESLADDQEGFELIREFNLPMSWSDEDDTAVYVYELVG